MTTALSINERRWTGKGQAMARQHPAGGQPGSEVIRLKLPRLEEAAELGRALIARVPGSGMLMVDPQLRILLAEGDVYRDRDVAHIVGRRIRDLVPASSWEVLEPRYLAAVGGRAQSFEFDATAYGSAHSMRFAPIRDGAAVIGVLVLSQDITSRRPRPAGRRQRAPAARRCSRCSTRACWSSTSTGRLVQANRHRVRDPRHRPRRRARRPVVVARRRGTPDRRRRDAGDRRDGAADRRGRPRRRRRGGAA